MTLADYSMAAFALLNGRQDRRVYVADHLRCISAVEKLVSSPARQPAVPARRPLLLAKLRGFAGQLLGALHESRRRRAAIILREHAPLTQLRSGGANND